MKKTTFTVTAETVYRITRAVDDGDASSCGDIAEFTNQVEAIETAKALAAATPGAALDIKVKDSQPLPTFVELSPIERGVVLKAAIEAVTHSMSGRSYTPDQAACELVGAALKAVSVVDRRAAS